MTAIRQMDLSAGPRELTGLEGYDRCMIVMRWRGRVVGRVFLPVTDGRVEADAVERTIAGQPGQEAISRWLDELLGPVFPATNGTPLPPATVAICTRERPEHLTAALRAVTALEREPCEILVVDNAPVTDRTRDVVRQFPAARYVCEARQGLNAARNRALREARGDVVAFTDDDAVPEREWLGALVRNFARPRVACATGLTLALELETDAQELFEEYSSFVRGFSRRLFDGCITDPLVIGGAGAGANMAVRRRDVLEVGGFDEGLDAGTETRSGGDHEMFTRLLIAGRQIAYDPDAVSWHCHRRSDQELLDTVYGYGVGVYAMWTGLLLERGELDVLGRAWVWLWQGHLPALVGLHPGGRRVARLARAELRGCLRGPAAWFRARRRLREARAC